jgi:putative addiction module component (TIGR02574 family)
MSTLIKPDQLAKLSMDERLALLELVWESILADSDQIPAPDWHREVVRERLRAMDADPKPGIPAAEALVMLGKRRA